MLDSRSRFLFLLLAVAITASIVCAYWNTMVQKNFTIINDVEEELISGQEVFEG